MIPLSYKEQALLMLGINQGFIKLSDVNIIYSGGNNGLKALKRLVQLGYFKDQNGRFVYTGKKIW